MTSRRGRSPARGGKPPMSFPYAFTEPANVWRKSSTPMNHLDHVLHEAKKTALTPQEKAEMRAVLLGAGRNQPAERLVSYQGFNFLNIFSMTRTAPFASSIAAVLVVLLGVSGYAYASPSVT